MFGPICLGTNNLSKKADSLEETYLGIIYRFLFLLGLKINAVFVLFFSSPE